MLSSPEGAQLMHGLSLAEAFQRFVLNHPDVVPLANAAMKLDRSYEGVFREGQYPGHYVKFSWPLDISAEDLAFDFVRPFIFSLDSPTPEAPIEIKRVSLLLVERLLVLRDLLASGKLIGRGTFVNTGEVVAVHRLQWKRREVLIDIQNSDLLETENNKPVIKWSGVLLEASTTLSAAPQANTPVASNRKLTAQRASIDEAVKANWPEGIPKGLPGQKRDQIINDWQRHNGLAVTSSKTISRHLAGN